MRVRGARSRRKERGGSAMAGTPRFVIAALVAGFNQAACAQHGDFAPKVQMILDYLKDSGETCISPDIPGARSFSRP